MATSDRAMECELAAGLIAGRPGFADAFAAVATAPIWSAVLAIEGPSAAVESAFQRVLEAIRKDGFRLLEGFDGRAELAVYLKLLARQILYDEIAAAIAVAPQEAWPRFERAFGSPIRKRIMRRFPRAQASHDDLYQDVCVRLVEDGCRRLRAFDGRGRFEAYVFVLIERMLIDLMRKENARRRLPAAIETMPALEQAVFVEVAWRRAPPDAGRLCAVLAHRFSQLDEPAAAQALAVVRPFIDRASMSSAPKEISIDDAVQSGAQLLDHALDPERTLLARETEGARNAFLLAVRDEAELMPPEERAYLTLILSSTEPEPPRELARRMGRSVEDIRRIQARVLRRLRKLPAARKFAALSVSGEGEEHTDG